MRDEHAPGTVSVEMPVNGVVKMVVLGHGRIAETSFTEELLVQAVNLEGLLGMYSLKAILSLLPPAPKKEEKS